MKHWFLIDGRICPWWFCPTFDNPLRRLLHPPRSVLGDLVKPGQKVLDIGCGMGYFTLPMAQWVGPAGLVIAADVQEKMLAGVERRLRLEKRVRLHRCPPDRIGLAEPVDFALAFWMVHEVPNPAAFLAELAGLLAPEGRLLVAEPLLHVSQSAFDRTVQVACQAGLIPVTRPSVRFSRAVLFIRAGASGG